MIVAEIHQSKRASSLNILTVERCKPKHMFQQRKCLNNYTLKEAGLIQTSIKIICVKENSQSRTLDYNSTALTVTNQGPGKPT